VLLSGTVPPSSVTRQNQNRSESIRIDLSFRMPATAGHCRQAWFTSNVRVMSSWPCCLGHRLGYGKIGKLDLAIRIDQGRKASVRITCPQSSADPPLFLLLWYFTTVFVCFSCSDFFSISLLSACTCVSLHSIFTTWELHYILLPHVTNLFCLRFCL